MTDRELIQVVAKRLGGVWFLQHNMSRSDILTSRDAAQKVVETLDEEQTAQWGKHLEWLVGRVNDGYMNYAKLANASAKQRIEACAKVWEREG